MPGMETTSQRPQETPRSTEPAADTRLASANFAARAEAGGPRMADSGGGSDTASNDGGDANATRRGETGGGGESRVADARATENRERTLDAMARSDDRPVSAEADSATLRNGRGDGEAVRAASLEAMTKPGDRRTESDHPEAGARGDTVDSPLAEARLAEADANTRVQELADHMRHGGDAAAAECHHQATADAIEARAATRQLEIDAARSRIEGDVVGADTTSSPDGDEQHRDPAETDDARADTQAPEATATGGESVRTTDTSMDPERNDKTLRDEAPDAKRQSLDQGIERADAVGAEEHSVEDTNDRPDADNAAEAHDEPPDGDDGPRAADIDDDSTEKDDTEQSSAGAVDNEARDDGLGDNAADAEGSFEKDDTEADHSDTNDELISDHPEDPGSGDGQHSDEDQAQKPDDEHDGRLLGGRDADNDDAFGLSPRSGSDHEGDPTAESPPETTATAADAAARTRQEADAVRAAAEATRSRAEPSREPDSPPPIEAGHTADAARAADEARRFEPPLDQRNPAAGPLELRVGDNARSDLDAYIRAKELERLAGPPPASGETVDTPGGTLSSKEFDAAGAAVDLHARHRDRNIPLHDARAWEQINATTPKADSSDRYDTVPGKSAEEAVYEHAGVRYVANPELAPPTADTTPIVAGDVPPDTNLPSEPLPEGTRTFERVFVNDLGQPIHERTTTKTFTGAPESLRAHPETAALDARNRATFRRENADTVVAAGRIVTITDSHGRTPEALRRYTTAGKIAGYLNPSGQMDAGHHFAQQYGPAEGESAEEAASDQRTLSWQSASMNRGHLWREMEDAVTAYRTANPEESITISVTERTNLNRTPKHPPSRPDTHDE